MDDRALRGADASGGRDGGQFAALLAIVLVAPLPLGSNRAWAVGLLGASILVLLLYHLATGGPRENPATSDDGRQPWRRARVAFFAMAAWVLLIAIQVAPLPAPWVQSLRFGAPTPLDTSWSYASIDPHSTRLYLLKAVAMLAFFALVLRLTTSETRIERLVQTIVIGGCVQAVLGIVLLTVGAHYSIFFVDVDHRRGAIGTYVNHNHFAGYLEMALAAGIGLMIARIESRRPQTWRQWARGWLAALVSGKASLRLMLVIMVIALIGSRSRMGNGAFFVSLLVVAGIAIVSSRRTPRAVLVFIASLIVLDVVLIGSLVGLDRVMERIRQTQIMEVSAQPLVDSADGTMALNAPAAAASRTAPRIAEQEESFEARARAALHALALVREHPVVGTGGGTFHIAFAPYRPPELPGYFDHAHNDFVEFLIETGVVGFALLAVVAGASVFHAVRILVVRRNALARGMAFASLMGVVAMLLHGLVDFNLQIPANAMTFVALLSLPYLVGWRPGSAGVRASKQIT